MMGGFQDDLRVLRDAGSNHGNNNNHNRRQQNRQQQNPRWQTRGRDRQRRARARNGQQAQGGNPDRRRYMENARNQKFWRTAGQMSYIITQKRGMCASCFQDGHNWDKCTDTPVKTAPPGYEEYRQSLQNAS